MKGLETDVIVVAAGVAGLAAAITAAEKGAKVIVFEKASTTGGAGNMGMGPFGVESRLQKEKGMSISKDEAFKIFMDYTHWRVDARLVRAYIDKAATTIDWLEKMGVEFIDATAYFPGGQLTWHLVKPATGQPGPMAAGTMMKIMTDRAKELGVKILLQTPAQKIIKGGGRITGVKEKTRPGILFR
jgi:fumarate reductase flavoprotein subunit